MAADNSFPFQPSDGAVKELPLTWAIVNDPTSDYEIASLRLLGAFRKRFPALADLPANDLQWGVVWTEGKGLIDMSKRAEDRVEARLFRLDVYLYVASPDGKERLFSRRAATWPPEEVRDFLLEEEVSRRSTSDIAWHDGLFGEATSTPTEETIAALQILGVGPERMDDVLEFLAKNALDLDPGEPL